MKTKALGLFFLLVTTCSFAQHTSSNESGSWYALVNNVKITNKFSVGNVIELRMVDFAKHARILLLVPRVNYSLNKNLTLSVGYNHVNYWQKGIRPPTLDYEDRLFQQVSVSSTLNWASLGHRFRIEERFKAGLDGSSSYANRFRYRLLVDFNIIRIKNGYLTGRIYDEVRIGFGSGLKEPKFDQNNFAALLGYSLSKNSKVYMGYGRNTYKSKSSGSWGDHLLHIKLHHNLNIIGKNSSKPQP